MEDKALNYRKQIKVGAPDVGATIEKLKKQQFQYATAGDARRLIEEIERLRAVLNGILDTPLYVTFEGVASLRERYTTYFGIPWVDVVTPPPPEITE